MMLEAASCNTTTTTTITTTLSSSHAANHSAALQRLPLQPSLHYKSGSVQATRFSQSGVGLRLQPARSRRPSYQLPIKTRAQRWSPASNGAVIGDSDRQKTCFKQRLNDSRGCGVHLVGGELLSAKRISQGHRIQSTRLPLLFGTLGAGFLSGSFTGKKAFVTPDLITGHHSKQFRTPRTVRRTSNQHSIVAEAGPDRDLRLSEKQSGTKPKASPTHNKPAASKRNSQKKKHKPKFKRARYAEIPQDHARSILAAQYTAAQGIPYRAPAEFKLWVQYMMAGPEHVLLAEAGDYIFQDGRRLVRPYFFEFVSHVKSRWAGQNIVELFANEFRQRDRAYYLAAVEDGRLQVDGRKVPPSYHLQQGQTVVHFVHRHEPPVMDNPVTVLFSDADVVVVAKPASVPVHPCGQYRKNTVLGILQAEHPELGTLSPIHRLDRLVSGLLILARNPETANRFRKDITANEVQKEYVARVVGVFPEGPIEAAAPLLYDGKEGRAIVEVPGEPNDPAAIAAAMQNGGQTRNALTRFWRLSTDGATSVVACQPLTGRTHQIRVHLQYLGHPIANDFLYLYPGPLPEEARKLGGDTTADVAAARGAAKLAAAATVAGATLSGAIRVVVAAKARKAREEAEATRRQGLGVSDGVDAAGLLSAAGLVSATGSVNATGLDDAAGWQGSESLPNGNDDAGRQPVQNGRSVEGQIEPGEVQTEGPSAANPGRSSVKIGASDESIHTGDVSAHGTSEKPPEALFEVDPYCTSCPSIGPTGYEEDQEGLWLHCIRYTGKTWSYECPLPDWAKL